MKAARQATKAGETRQNSVENVERIQYQDQFVYQGIYRKNTRGRAYLIFRDRNRERRIVRTSAKLAAENGQNVTIVGAIRAGRLIPGRVIPWVAPVAKRGRGRQAA